MKNLPNSRIKLRLFSRLLVSLSLLGAVYRIWMLQKNVTEYPILLHRGSEMSRSNRHALFLPSPQPSPSRGEGAGIGSAFVNIDQSFLHVC